MHKHLYRTVEKLLAQIDAADGGETMLIDIVRLIVESPEMAEYGVASGRLYRERSADYKLIASFGEHGEAIAGKTVRKSYQVIQDIERRKHWVISPDSPGWDAELEAQFSDLDAAAILIGRDPAYILSLGIRHHGSESDLLVLLETLRAAVGLKLREQAFASQIRQARAIQRSLLPRNLAKLPGYDIAAVSRPAAEVGGDVYDVQKIETGVLGVMLADASGHGLPAALQARDVVIGLRMGQAKDEKIGTVVTRLNRVIHHSGLSSRFISLFYGELEETGNLVYVNCGHPRPLLFNEIGDVFELKTSGPVLGPLPEAVYRRGYVNLRPGETLVLFTDGVTERAENQDDVHPDSDSPPVEYGQERLIALVRTICGRPSAEIAERIVDDVRNFGHGRPFSDDVSVMVVKREKAEDYPPAESLTLLDAGQRR